MPTAEAITRINERYYADLRRARRHPVTTKKGNVGVRRARLIAQARRTRTERLSRLGVRSWR